MSPKIRQLIIVFLTVCSLVMVWLAVTLPLGGHSTGYVSNRYYSVITPAGWAFSIWSLIYSGVIAFTVWQALPAQRSNTQLAQAAPWVMGTQIANALWLPAWHFMHLPLSLVIIGFYLFCTVMIVEVFRNPSPSPKSVRFWLGFVLFSVYAGWLTIATVANATVVLLSENIQLGLNPEAWGVIMLCIAFLIGFTVFRRWQSPAYLLVIVWAFLAIAYAHPSQMQVHYTAITLAALAAVLSFVALYQKLRPRIA